jgi:hypothetical protein
MTDFADIRERLEKGEAAQKAFERTGELRSGDLSVFTIKAPSDIARLLTEVARQAALLEEARAIDFNGLVDYGKARANIVNGMPWSFEYEGIPITHESDQCYLVCEGLRPLRLYPRQVLVLIQGTPSIWSREGFEKVLLSRLQEGAK